MTFSSGHVQDWLSIFIKFLDSRLHRWLDASTPRFPVIVNVPTRMKPGKIVFIGLNFLIVIALVAVNAAAQNLLVNGSFESGAFSQNFPIFPNRMQLTTGSTAVTGWSVGAASGNNGYL